MTKEDWEMGNQAGAYYMDVWLERVVLNHGFYLCAILVVMTLDSRHTALNPDLGR